MQSLEFYAREARWYLRKHGREMLAAAAFVAAFFAFVWAVAFVTVAVWG